ncbi:MAG: hypothetical protein EHM36_16475 [Deltaproteobacteria bacterium]|nr:MAG: hypothetical protein EHM36_16475 [Deltaproteobacteria bacterium]
MIGMTVILDGCGCWPDLQGKKIIRATRIQVAALQGGMKTGAPSVAFRIDLEDGQTVIAETSLKLLLTASDLFRAKYGDPR